MLKIPLYMVSPEAVSQCCSTATAIVYENARTHDTATIYKEEFVEEYTSSDNTDRIIESLKKNNNEAFDTLKKTISIKGSSYSSQKRGQHYIYVLTNTVNNLNWVCKFDFTSGQ